MVWLPIVSYLWITLFFLAYYGFFHYDILERYDICYCQRFHFYEINTFFTLCVVQYVFHVDARHVTKIANTLRENDEKWFCRQPNFFHLACGICECSVLKLYILYFKTKFVMILSLILLKIHYRFNHFITNHGWFYLSIYRKTAIPNT